MLSFGDKVRECRLSKGLTMEEVCGDESELSVRHLARIEKGQSLPTLAKVYYLADQLGVSVGMLADSQYLSSRYKELKYLILRTPTYLLEDRLSQREHWFDEIYENYYYDLPESEQLIMDCLQAKTDVLVSQNVAFASGLLEEYLGRALEKSKYVLEDLVLFSLYAVSLDFKSDKERLLERAVFENVVKHLLLKDFILDAEDYFILINTLTVFASDCYRYGSYSLFRNCLDFLQDLVQKTQDFQKMPVICLLEWKYYLFCEHNQMMALEYYNKAIMFVELTQEKGLKERLEMEWERDQKEGVSSI